MSKKELVVMVSHVQETSFTLEQLAEVCGVSVGFIKALVEYGILQPQAHFDLSHLQRVRLAARLQRELEIEDIGSLAIIIDLLQEVESLRRHIAVIEKHFF
ncbi:MAG: hypothetical protein EPO11_00480 [Gammaproteobacteria bacterium]|nr:MAG: hypothetical protein EPO11_00480 [Gammaproteobacteria bacterium]